MSKQIGFVILGVFGVLGIVGVSIFLSLFDRIVNKKIKEELPLNNGSDSFKRWRENKAPVYLKFHIFHLNNTNYNHNLSNIKLVERGPYVFEEKRYKENINYFTNDKNEFLLSYREHKIYTFSEKLSKGVSLNDSVTVINLPFLGILFSNSPFGALVRTIAVKALSNRTISDNEKSLFTNRTVGELLFEGFNLKLFEQIENLAKSLNITIKLNPFSIYEGGRNISEEPWAIHPGIVNMDEFGEIAEFDGFSTLVNKGYLGKPTPIWTRDPNNTKCNKLKGTDGTMFPPSLSKSQRIYVFEPQLCRTVFFDFKGETSVKDIKTYRYVIPHQYFQSPLSYPESECYCLESNITAECNWNGVLDMSNCERVSNGAPVQMSGPYFIHGDQHIRDLINLKIDAKDLTDDKYGTYLDIEPMTGTVLKAVRRLQINVKLVPEDHFPELKLLEDTKDKKLIIPLVWIEETGEADDKQANEFKEMVTNKLKLGIGISIAVLVIGTLILLTSIIQIIRHRKRIGCKSKL